MRVNPVLVKHVNLSHNTFKTQFEKNNFSNDLTDKKHCYTGNPCADLAYASLFDNAIAQELKLMGLI